MLSRRKFLGWCGWTSAAFVPAPLRGLIGPPLFSSSPSGTEVRPVDYRLTPHYRAKSPLDDVLRKTQPGLDAFLTEKYESEIEAILAQWSAGLLEAAPSVKAVQDSLASGFKGTSLAPKVEPVARSEESLSLWRGDSSGAAALGREAFVRTLTPALLKTGSRLITAEFKVTQISFVGGSSPGPAAPNRVRTRVRYDLVSTGAKFQRRERIGHWDLEWEVGPDGAHRVAEWQVLGETGSQAPSPIFVDITEKALGSSPSYAEQMLHGSEHWRTVLDGACGIDVYGNNGVAVGDIDNDGFDDIYVCQSAGLPNRLYRNRGDGTFEEVTAASGVDVLDNTASALFADVDNDGNQDLVVVRANGPLLFLNQGGGKFRLKPDAFRFARPPEGTFTAAAVADYDHDGMLDIYFCLYSYYQGLSQYQFPLPYYDAENGPPNFLFHNNGDGTFTDVTAATGMNQNNHRFSFACGWGDYNNDGWPDLYVANDFGRKNLYRNNGDGTFTDVAAEAGVEDIGAGMSVCWLDYDDDGNQDLYVADMWSAAGKRVTMQDAFLKDAPETIRALCRKHANGNSLLQNGGNGRFEDKSAASGCEMGRWAWSSDAWDFDHDGYPDLYIANGMISGSDTQDLSSFFWRRVVSQSPQEARTSYNYEQGWNAINELIRSDGTWSGYERNIFYVNNRDGTFSDISGTVGLDFVEDGRAFSLSDIDHDGRLEIVLKNRNSPQLRILRNEMRAIGESIAFRLRGHKSNRDAIGAAIMVETGKLRQTKFIQAGSGFLSQHTKQLFFGLGHSPDAVRATVRWPSGLNQHFENLPAGHEIEIEESVNEFHAVPFGSTGSLSRSIGVSPAPVAPGETCPDLVGSPAAGLPAAPSLHSGQGLNGGATPAIETWLIAPLAAPEFSLPDLAGRVHTLAEFKGRKVLLNFWATWCPLCQGELQVFERFKSRWASRGLEVLAVNVNQPNGADTVRALAKAKELSLNILLASEDVAGIYNVLYRYLFDRRRDLGIPTSFLVDEQGFIVKVYQGRLDPERLEKDLENIPRNEQNRVKAALPFPGKYYSGSLRRNNFTYGVVFYQQGYLDQAVESFRLAIRDNPEYADAYYNLGTLYMKKGMTAEAIKTFERALQIRPDYPDALNNLGMLAAQAGRDGDALRYFQEAIRKNPKYVIALQNLGNLYRQQGKWTESRQALERALQLDPEDPEVNYSLGMLFARQDDTTNAGEYLRKAVKLRPEYPEALNNLGVLYLRIGQQERAASTFEECIRVAPDFDQAYINLARMYVTMNDRQKAHGVLRQLLERKPDHPVARHALEQLSQ